MERIDKLEMIVGRLARKSKAQKMKALITPFPISNAVFGEDIRGSVLRYMFPCDGTILKGMIKLGVKPKESITAIISLIGTGTKSQTIDLTNRVSEFKDSFPVTAGDCLDLVIDSGKGKVSEIWAAFLWVPSVSDIEIKSFLVDHLLDEVDNSSVEPQEL